jgi:hypothetical protein
MEMDRREALKLMAGTALTLALPKMASAAPRLPVIQTEVRQSKHGAYRVILNLDEICGNWHPLSNNDFPVNCDSFFTTPHLLTWENCPFPAGGMFYREGYAILEPKDAQISLMSSMRIYYGRIKVGQVRSVGVANRCMESMLLSITPESIIKEWTPPTT